MAQSRAVSALAERVDNGFRTAVELISHCNGRLIVCGIGKSGHIGKKLAATFACSGTPSLFLHAGEAAHGDLGMVGQSDVVIMISNSGETEEVVRLIPFLREMDLDIIALVGNRDSSIARCSDCILDVSVERESCPHDLVPTTSALVTLAMGDALAMAVMRTRRFTKLDFRKYHPGGSLGRKTSSRVRDIMQRQPLPTCSAACLVGEMLQYMSHGRCGMIIVTDNSSVPIGLVTDGDLRRALQRHTNLLKLPVSKIMTMKPVTIHELASTRDARERMHRLRLKALVVVDGEGKLTGVVEIFGDQSID
jgi:arabinose-5-phosphate isomerase